MHQMSPGVERAVASARAWAERQSASAVQLTHFLLALLDEDEGRPALLLESVGLVLTDVRQRLIDFPDPPIAPAEGVLFMTARDWSLAYRHDPEFLTDAFLLAVLRANPTFERGAAGIGLDAARLEAALLRNRRTDEQPAAASEIPGELFALPDATQPMAPDALPLLSHSPLGFVGGRPNPAPKGEGALSGSPSPFGGGGWRVGSDSSPPPPLPNEERGAARVLDANFNRAREAARVLEDYCRFVLDDRTLTEEVKTIRHGLAHAAGRLPAPLLLAARDTPGDIGAAITAAGEYDRSSPAQVAMVNAKRLQEALRSLEEFSKLFDPEMGRALEAIRYRSYTLERSISSGIRGRERLTAARLYLLLGSADCRAALDWTIERAIAGGVDVVQLREKGVSDRELLARAREVREWTRKAGVLFIVNDRPDVARLVEADGVHLGQDDLSITDARRIVGPDLLVGVSTHRLEQVQRAVLDGADYLGVGPVFPSKTKTFDDFPGLEFVQVAASQTTLPQFALGGIGLGNIAAVVQAGARRIAISSAIAQSHDPERSARELRQALERSEQLAE